MVPVESLEIGMEVVRLDIPWEDSDFLLQGFIISSEVDLQSLREQCQHVYIRAESETDKLIVSNKRSNRPAQVDVTVDASVLHQPGVKSIKQVPFEREIREAEGAFRQARSLAKDILANIRLGRALDISECEAVVDRCVDSIIRNPSALLLLTQIKNRDDYTAEHSMNVCILSATFARHLGLSEEEIKTVGLCGLLHDVGKNRVSLDILNKAGALTKEEFDEMKKHPTYGRDLLMSTAGCQAITVDVTFSHHEREDGRGYPRGLSSENIPYFAKLVSLADTYDAITSHRCYDRGRTSAEALEIIHQMRGTQFNSELAEAFIECIGEYPPGCLVELNTGEVAIVTRCYRQDRRRPKVLVVRSAEKGPLPFDRVVDLRREQDRDIEKKISIYSEIRNGSYGIELKHYLDNGLVVGHG
jgi:HD-GYP domain-containing protein (c-di-GMP phosphodiesterase class II)